MKVSRAKKSLVLIITITYFSTQVALGSLAESNIWAERKSHRHSGESRNPGFRLSSKETNKLDPGFHRDDDQVASLPSQFSNPQSILNQMPAVGGALPTLPKWSDTNKNLSRRLPKQFQSLVDSIPLVYGSIQDVYDSGNQKIAPVVLVQDVHLNSEAQTNIASLLQELIDQKQVGLVGVEGAFTRFDFSRFRVFPDKQITKEVIEAFLNKNLLAAPSYVGITSETEPPLFVGVDDHEHYKANVAAYLSTVEQKEKIKNQLSTIEKELTAKKAITFSPELKSFDEMRTAYHKGKIGLGEYVKKLNVSVGASRWLARNTDSPLEEGTTPFGRASGSPLQIEIFLTAYEMESTLDFKKVDEERRVVIEGLTKKLKEKELSDLLSQSLAYRMGHLSYGTYYQNLKNLCAEKGISLRKTPAFDEYIRYVLLSDGIKADKLFESLKNTEQKVLERLIRNPEEKNLAELSEYLMLMERLVDFALTPAEWNEYIIKKRALHEISAIKMGPGSLASYESFYQEADFRSHKMVENLLKTVIPADDGSKILVAGGFHTPQVAALLKNQKISYIVVSPKITKIEEGAGTSYLSVFSREKTPLDQIFKGESLFLSPTQVHVPSYKLGVPLLAGLTSLQTHLNPVNFNWHGTNLSVHVPPDITSLADYHYSVPGSFLGIDFLNIHPWLIILPILMFGLIPILGMSMASIGLPSGNGGDSRNIRRVKAELETYFDKLRPGVATSGPYQLLLAIATETPLSETKVGHAFEKGELKLDVIRGLINNIGHINRILEDAEATTSDRSPITATWLRAIKDAAVKFKEIVGHSSPNSPLLYTPAKALEPGKPNPDTGSAKLFEFLPRLPKLSYAFLGGILTCLVIVVSNDIPPQFTLTVFSSILLVGLTSSTSLRLEPINGNSKHNLEKIIAELSPRALEVIQQTGGVTPEWAKVLNRHADNLYPLNWALTAATDAFADRAYWPTLIEIFFKADKNGLKLIGHTLPILKNEIHSSKDLRRVGLDLIQIASADEESADWFFKIVALRLNDLFADHLMTYWDDIVKICLVAGPSAVLLVDDGFGELHSSFGNENFFNNWAVFKNIAIKSKLNTYLIFHFGLPLFAHVTDKKELEKIGDDFVTLLEPKPDNYDLMRSISTARKQFGEQFFTLWPTLDQLATKSGTSAEYLFNYGFLAMKKFIHTPEDVRKFGFEMLDMVTANPGMNARTFFEESLPSLINYLGEDFLAYWPTILKVAGDPQSGYGTAAAFTEIHSLREIIHDPKDFEKYARDLIRIANSDPGRLALQQAIEHLKKVLGNDLSSKWDDVLHLGLSTGKNCYEVFNEGLEPATQAIGPNWSDPDYWTALVKIAEESKENTNLIFEKGLPFLKKHGMLESVEDLKSYSRDMNAMAQAAGGNAVNVFYSGLNSVEPVSEDKMKSHWPDYVAMVIATREKVNDLLYLALPEIKESLGSRFFENWKALVHFVTEAGVVAPEMLRVCFRQMLKPNTTSQEFSALCQDFILIAKNTDSNLLNNGGLGQWQDVAGEHLLQLWPAIRDMVVALGPLASSVINQRASLLETLLSNEPVGGMENIRDRVKFASDYLSVVAHISKAVRQHSLDEFELTPILQFLFKSPHNPYRLRALFDIYFNKFEPAKIQDARKPEEEIHRMYIDRLSLKRGERQPYAFYDQIPLEFQKAHQQQSRKLDLTFFVPFMTSLVEEDGTLRASYEYSVPNKIPPAELFFKLFASGNGLHEWDLLKKRVRDHMDRLLISSNPIKARALLNNGLMILDRRFGLANMKAKVLSDEKLTGGVAHSPAYDMARFFSDWLELSFGILEIDRVTEESGDKTSPVYLAEQKTLEAADRFLAAAPEEREALFTQFTQARDEFRKEFQDQQLNLIMGIFRKNVNEDPEIFKANLALLSSYQKRIGTNQDKKNEFDSLYELLSTNQNYPEVARSLYQDIVAQAKGEFKLRRYTSPDYLRSLDLWVKAQHEAGKSESEIATQRKKIQDTWEKNLYFSFVDSSTGKKLYAGFTDDFPTLLNLGNPIEFNSCQATNKPTYNRGLSGTLSNGWNKAIVIFSENGEFIGRRILRLRVTNQGELILFWEPTYQDIKRGLKEEEIKKHLDQTYAVVASQLGVRTESTTEIKNQKKELITMPVYLGHSEWEYSDRYGKQFSGTNDGLMHINASHAMEPKLNLSLYEPQELPLPAPWTPVSESEYLSAAFNKTAPEGGVKAPLSPNIPKPINLKNSLQALAWVASLSLLVLLGFSTTNTADVAHVKWVLLTLPLFVSVLVLMTAFFRFAPQSKGPNKQTGPPQIILYGKPALSSPEANLISFQKKSATNPAQFLVNPRLFSLLTHRLFVVRFVTHFILNLFYIPVHERGHAAGIESELGVYSLQLLPVAVMIGASFFVPVRMVIGVSILAAAVPTFIAAMRRQPPTVIEFDGSRSPLSATQSEDLINDEIVRYNIQKLQSREFSDAWWGQTMLMSADMGFLTLDAIVDEMGRILLFKNHWELPVDIQLGLLNKKMFKLKITSKHETKMHGAKFEGIWDIDLPSSAQNNLNRTFSEINTPPASPSSLLPRRNGGQTSFATSPEIKTANVKKSLEKAELQPQVGIYLGDFLKGNGATIRVAKIPKGSVLPLHIHPHTEDYFILSKIEAILQIGNKTYQVKAGDWARIPKNTPHTISPAKAESNDPLTLFFWYPGEYRRSLTPTVERVTDATSGVEVLGDAGFDSLSNSRGLKNFKSPDSSGMQTQFFSGKSKTKINIPVDGSVMVVAVRGKARVTVNNDPNKKVDLIGDANDDQVDGVTVHRGENKKVLIEGLDDDTVLIVITSPGPTWKYIWLIFISGFFLYAVHMPVKILFLRIWLAHLLDNFRENQSIQHPIRENFKVKEQSTEGKIVGKEIEKEIAELYFLPGSVVDPNKPTVVFVPGAEPHLNGFSRFVERYKDEANIAFFAYDYRQPLDKLADELIKARNDPRLRAPIPGSKEPRVSFVLYSYGQLVHRQAVLKADKGVFFNDAPAVIIGGVWGGSAKAMYISTWWAKRYARFLDRISRWLRHFKTLEPILNRFHQARIKEFFYEACDPLGETQRKLFSQEASDQFVSKLKSRPFSVMIDGDFNSPYGIAPYWLPLRWWGILKPEDKKFFEDRYWQGRRETREEDERIINGKGFLKMFKHYTVLADLKEFPKIEELITQSLHGKSAIDESKSYMSPTSPHKNSYEGDTRASKPIKVIEHQIYTPTVGVYTVDTVLDQLSWNKNNPILIGPEGPDETIVAQSLSAMGKTNFNIHDGNYPLSDWDGNWVRVPAAGADMKILEAQFLDEQGKVIPNLELGTDRAGQFYIRHTNENKVSGHLAFKVAVPKTYEKFIKTTIPTSHTTIMMPQNLPDVIEMALREIGIGKGQQHLDEVINPLITFFSNKSDANIPLEEKGTTLEAIIKSPHASCRQRAYAFTVIAQALGIEARYAESAVHAFVQVKIPKQGWILIDLGGIESSVILLDEKPKAAALDMSAKRKDSILKSGIIRKAAQGFILIARISPSINKYLINNPKQEDFLEDILVDVIKSIIVVLLISIFFILFNAGFENIGFASPKKLSLNASSPLNLALLFNLGLIRTPNPITHGLTIVEPTNEQKSMQQGVELLATMGADLVLGNVYGIMKSRSIGLNGQPTSEDKEEAALLAQLPQWIQNPVFRTLLIENIHGKLGNKHQRKMSAEDAADFLIAHVLATTGPRLTGNELKGRRDLLLKGEDDTSIRVLVMAMLLKVGLGDNVIVFDSTKKDKDQILKAKANINNAVTLLRKTYISLADIKVVIIPNTKIFSQDLLDVRDLEADPQLGGASLVVVPNGMKPINPPSSVKTYAELLPLLEKFDFNTFIQFFRRALINA